MAIRDSWHRVAAVLSLASLSAGCSSVANLSYHEVARDLASIVTEDLGGTEPKLLYHTEATISPWYLRWTMLLPLKPLLLLFLPDAEQVQLDNPSERARDLVVELAPKAGADLQRNAATVLSLVPILQLDPSALNRICALDGLGLIAAAQGVDLIAGLEAGSQRLQRAEDAQAWITEFAALAPQRREPAGSGLDAPSTIRYRSVLAALTAQPLPTWTSRRALVGDLSRAIAAEPDEELRSATAAALHNAIRHAVQWAVVDALTGQAPALVDVRLRALELLHRAGGPDSVPLLLALMINSAENKAAGLPDFDPDVMMQRRLIHLCGQLDATRAVQSVHLPGREKWQAIAPAEFLAILALDPDAFQKPTTLPAREALARCLGRPRIGLADDIAPDGVDWIAKWRDDFASRQASR